MTDNPRIEFEQPSGRVKIVRADSTWYHTDGPSLILCAILTELRELRDDLYRWRDEERNR